MICEPIGTQDKMIACFDRKRTFNVNLYKWIWAKAACDHIAGMKQFNVVNGRSSQSNHFPLQTVVKCELFNATSTHAVNTTVAHMSDGGTVFGEAELQVVPMPSNSRFSRLRL